MTLQRYSESAAQDIIKRLEENQIDLGLMHSNLIAATLLSLSLAACSAVDLNEKAGPPTCSVSADDYATLHSWNDKTADKEYVKLISDLEKKYSRAPKVDGRSAVVAAQSYVRTNKDASQDQIRTAVNASCT